MEYHKTKKCPGRNLACKFCDEVFPTVRESRYHHYVSHNYCLKCQMKFKFRTELLEHMGYCDPDDNYEKIKNIESPLSYKGTPKKHGSGVVKDNICILTHKCDFCEKSYKNEADLRKHQTKVGHYKTQGSIYFRFESTSRSQSMNNATKLFMFWQRIKNLIM